jgi:hypothetical protein
MDEMDFDVEEFSDVAIVEEFDDEEYGCDDVRPAWLSAELSGIDAATQIGFNAVWQDR